MEILTAIVAAISLGAAEGLKTSASHAVVEAYDALKGYLRDHYRSIDLTKIQEKPNSDARKAVLVEDLRESEAEKDPKLLAYANSLLEAVPSAGSDGVVIRDARAALNIILSNITASGGGVVAEGLVAEGGDIRITDIVAGRPASPKNL